MSETMKDALQRERPWLLLPSGPCEFCGLRSAQVGPLCANCDADADVQAGLLGPEDDEARLERLACYRADAAIDRLKDET